MVGYDGIRWGGGRGLGGDLRAGCGWGFSNSAGRVIAIYGSALRCIHAPRA
ncbi:MAG: hypothetical protein NC092_11950 [Butyrivibrio sp.]|nr:hypothetical protein [Muribaculum sp.]MCM1553395.1 hypothetical protein [Butyrivibrio sp.]